MRTLILPAIALWPCLCSADTLTLSASKDNTIYSESSSLSNGAGSFLFAGTTGNGDARRALIQFDLSAIPPGSVIQSVTLRLSMSMTTAPAEAVELHRLVESWGESTSHAIGGEGAGAPAARDDATWQYSFFPAVDWTTLGGEFEAIASAAKLVAGFGLYTWGSTPGLEADVQGWVNDPASNAGWIVIGDESGPTTAKRFNSRTNASSPPQLVVTFTPPPPFSSCCTPGQAGVIVCPCSNPPSGADRGCDNMDVTGGASITGTGSNSLATPTLVFTTAGENGFVLSIMIQGSVLTTGSAFGHGVSCMTTFKRLYQKNAIGGSVSMPDLLIEPSIPTRSHQKGDDILAGQKRWYQVYYRDNTLLLTGCPSPETAFNVTNAAEVAWQP